MPGPQRSHIDWERLFADAPVAVSLIDTQGRHLFGNQAYADLLGYDLDELDLLDVGRITREQDAEWSQNYLLRLISGELESFSTFKEYVRKDGTTVRARLDARGIRDDGGNCTMLFGVLTPPIAGAAHQSRGSLADELLKYTTDTITVIDREGNIIEGTGRRKSLMGYAPEFFESRNIAEILAADERIDIFALREQLLAEPGAELQVETELIASDGSPQTVEVHAVNLLDDPAVEGIVLTSRNVTELRRRDQELTRRAESAEQLAQTQTRVLANVSHELRNPLHAIRGVAELLAAERLPPSASSLADSLVRQLSGLAAVTQDLLDAAALDAVSLNTAPVELVPLLEDVVALGQAQVADRPVQVSGDFAPDLPVWVVADADRLRQVLRNLVGNAVKFTHQGRVQLTARLSARGSVLFSVSDSGVGIPADEQTKILEPFAFASTAGAGRGAGLGLSIVQRLVGAMNGELHIESEVGRGTQIDVDLRLPEADPPVVEEPAHVPSGLTALVVEDDVVIQQLAARQLEQLGLIPIVVGTAEEAIDWLTVDDSPVIDVVLMDQQLPGLQGTEATEAIRKLPNDRAETPIIGVSASASASASAMFLAAGMDDFISKPASLDDLATVIERTLRSRAHRPADSRPAEVADAVVDPLEATTEPAVLTALARDLDTDTVVDLVRAFLTDLDMRIEAIEHGSQGAGDDARRAAHTLKSSAALMGATELASVCASIEAGEGHTSATIRTLATRTRHELERWVSDAS